MPGDVTVRVVGLDAVDRYLASLVPGIRKAVRKEIQTGITEAHEWMVLEVLTGGPSATQLAVRSGVLVRSIKTRVFEAPDGSIIGEIYQDPSSPATRYLPTHEYGATIRPRRAKALSIPLNEEARGYLSPRDFRGGLFFLPCRAGTRSGSWRRAAGPPADQCPCGGS